jgi:hypothetical protein
MIMRGSLGESEIERTGEFLYFALLFIIVENGYKRIGILD